MSRVRGAEPTTLFRGGGRTVADLMRLKPVPAWVPKEHTEEYQLTSLLEGEYVAASAARNRARSEHLRRARQA